SEPPIPGGGDGGTNPSPYFPGISPQNYGSGLWIQVQGIITNSFVGIISNTLPDIQYQILSAPSVLDTNWTSEGFVSGSEVTNWTAFAVNIAGRTNTMLFFKILSWEDSYDMGILDWGHIKYFGTNGIDPYGDPAGDGYSNLYKYQNSLNPFTFYQPPFPVVDAAPVVGDNGVTISWDEAQGLVVSYTIYRNGSAIATVPATQFSYTDTSVSIDLTDPNDTDFPYYQVAANYSGGSYLGGVDDASNPRLAIATEIVRGPGGQQILLVPNIPYGVTAIRVYVSAQGAYYPDSVIDELSYDQPIYSFDPTVSSNYFDVAVGSFTNGQYAIPPSLLPPFNNYTISCRALGLSGTFGPDDSTLLDSQLFDGDLEIPVSVPFVDGTEQLKENLAYELESADEYGSLAFGIISDQSPEPPDYVFPSNYACAGFTFPYDFGEPQSHSLRCNSGALAPSRFQSCRQTRAIRTA
ncbi:MAG: hypothetical protein ACREE6_16795, partial [Limisphaerales bacterium]